MKTTRNLMIGLALLGGIAMSSCGGKTEKERQLEYAMDSLSNADSLHQEDISNMVLFMNTLSDGLDSINGEQGKLKGMGVEGKKLDKARFREQLDKIKATIAAQKKRVAVLERKLANTNSSYGRRMKTLIENYKAQLEEKDAQIAELQKQIEEKNVNIATLTENVNKLTTDNTALNQTVETQKGEIAQQDETIHEAFVTIGTSKSLKAAGLLTGGFLAKKKVDVAKLNTSNFEKIDIRKYNDITLDSKKPQIMTQMPAGSYRIDENSNGTSTLHITNVDKFWSVSKYLIIKL